MSSINMLIIERKGNIIKDETIYNEGQFIRIKLIEYNGKIYWVKKINGKIEEFNEIGYASKVDMD